MTISNIRGKYTEKELKIMEATGDELEAALFKNIAEISGRDGGTLPLDTVVAVCASVFTNIMAASAISYEKFDNGNAMSLINSFLESLKKEVIRDYLKKLKSPEFMDALEKGARIDIIKNS